MTIQLAELTREQIKTIAPNTVALLPTAAVEQHGPHLPVLTDTIICGAVVERAALEASKTTQIVVAPVLCYGRSHHHRPFVGVLSLSTDTYMRALADILEGLVHSGFTKIVVLNGHGGNTEPNAVVCTDFIQRPGHATSIAYASYWDIARSAIVAQGVMPAGEIPGHAGRFETSMVMALRPELVNEEGLARTAIRPHSGADVARSLAGGTMKVHGAWSASPGYTDSPSAANAADGHKMLEITIHEVAAFLTSFDAEG